MQPVEPMQPVDVAAGVIYAPDGKILICQRQGELKGLWEFPGGKREAGEDFPACLRRELLEELCLEVKVEEEILSMPWAEGKLRFSFLKAQAQDTAVTLTVHADVRWVSVSELVNYPFCPADAAFLQQAGHFLS